MGMASGGWGAAKLAWLDVGAVASPAVSGERPAIHAIHNPGGTHIPSERCRIGAESQRPNG
ncbi:hypothetical protein BO443_50031 [Burkholderia orbicola]